MLRMIPKPIKRFIGHRLKGTSTLQYLREDLLEFSKRFFPADDTIPSYSILKQIAHNVAESMIRLRMIRGGATLIKDEFFMMELNLRIAKYLLKRLPFAVPISSGRPVKDITVILRKPEPNNQITLSLETRTAKIENIPLKTKLPLETIAEAIESDANAEKILMADTVDAIGNELLQFVLTKMSGASHKIHVHAASVPDLDILIAKVENRMAKDLPACGGFFYSIADKSTILKYDMCPAHSIKLEKELLPSNQILISHTAQTPALSPLFLNLFLPVSVADCRIGENGFTFELMARAGVLLCDDYDQHASILILE